MISRAKVDDSRRSRNFHGIFSRSARPITPVLIVMIWFIRNYTAAGAARINLGTFVPCGGGGEEGGEQCLPRELLSCGNHTREKQSLRGKSELRLESHICIALACARGARDMCVARFLHITWQSETNFNFRFSIFRQINFAEFEIYIFFFQILSRT